jgi:hypothetical protein
MTSTHKTDLERAAGDGVEKTPDAARQGIETHRMRWVLRISVALSVVAIAGAWLAYAPHAPPAPPSVVASTAR